MSKKQGLAYKLLGGFVIGVGFIVPGVSGAVLALLLGLYEPILAAIARPFANWRKNLELLLPLGIGAGVSLLFFARLFRFLFSHYPVPTLYLFCGLVLGSLPTLTRLGNGKSFRLSFLTSFLGGFALLYFFTQGPLLWGGTLPNLTGPKGLLALGLLIGFGIVVPGLSVSFLLLAFGVYEYVLAAAVNFDLAVLLPIALGFAPGLVGSSRLAAYLLGRSRGIAAYLILGLLVASLIISFPGLPRSLFEWSLALPVLFAGIWLSAWFSKQQAV